MSLSKVKAFFHGWESAALSLAVLAGAVIVGLIVYYIVAKTAGRLSRKTGTGLDDLLLKHCRDPARILIPLLSIYLFLPLADTSAGLSVLLNHLVAVMMILSVGWFVIRFAGVVEELVLNKFDTEAKDNLRARRVTTQIQVAKRIAVAVVGVVVFAAVLMTFPQVRQVGTSILASAGIIGIIVGFAAQRSIATLLAGVQIALTQPIRLDDVVIVEGEWGRIEEITLTYVVVRIWDLRRLVLPITHFLERPFQNWTRTSADLLGTVYLYVDYSVPVQEIREALKRILEVSSLWNGQVWSLQVTNVTDRTMELRALMSAADSSAAWALRCEVREKLIEFVQKNYPQSLPRLRAELKAPFSRDLQ